jgi:hypothetical protein
MCLFSNVTQGPCVFAYKYATFETSIYKLKRDEFVRECGSYWGGDNSCMDLVAKLEGKKPLGRPRCR